MRGTSDYDQKSYPFKVDNTGGHAFNVVDQRTLTTVFKGASGTDSAPAMAYADEHNTAYWANVSAGRLEVA